MVLKAKWFCVEFDDHMVVMEKIQMLCILFDGQLCWIDEQRTGLKCGGKEAETNDDVF